MAKKKIGKILFWYFTVYELLPVWAEIKTQKSI